MNWTLRKRLINALFGSCIFVLLAVMAGAILLGHQIVVTESLSHGSRELNEILKDLAVHLGLARNSVQSYQVSKNPAELQHYYHAIEEIEARRGELQSDELIAEHDASGDFFARLDNLMKDLSTLAALAPGQTPPEANSLLEVGKEDFDHISQMVDKTDEDLDETLAALELKTEWGLTLFAIFAGATIVAALIFMGVQYWMFHQEIGSRTNVEFQLQQSKGEIELISRLSDSLHSAISREESYLIIGAFARKILHGTSGCLYMYANSRDQLNLTTHWGDTNEASVVAHFPAEQCWALRRGRTYQGSTTEEHVNCAHVQEDRRHSYMCVPVTARGQTIGMLYVELQELDPALAFASTFRLAANFADQISLALSNIELRERLENMAIRDSLTGLFNRRFMDEMLKREIARTTRLRSNLSVLMIDVDHFKKLNDTFGHSAGDEVLKNLAAYLTQSLRQSDVACRYGGEELLIIIPDCGLAEATEKADKIRAGIKQLSLRAAGTELPPITVSIGVSSFPTSTTVAAEILPLADGALYRAKRAGRDRVFVAEDPANEGTPTLATANVAASG